MGFVADPRIDKGLTDFSTVIVPELDSAVLIEAEIPREQFYRSIFVAFS